MTRAKSGQPLRFLALLMIAWVAIRIAVQSGSSPLNPFPLVRGLPATAAIVRRQFSAKPPTRTAVIPRTVAIKPAAFRDTSMRFPRNVVYVALDPTPHSSASPITSKSDGPAQGPYAFPLPLPMPAPDPPNRPDRWHGSSWMLWRGGGMSQTDLARTGRLGGSQVGARLDYVLNPAARHRATAYARASSALDSPAAPEAAIGIALQPFTSLPVNVAVERRIALGVGARRNVGASTVGSGGGAVGGRLDAAAAERRRGRGAAATRAVVAGGRCAHAGGSGAAASVARCGGGGERAISAGGRAELLSASLFGMYKGKKNLYRTAYSLLPRHSKFENQTLRNNILFGEEFDRI